MRRLVILGLLVLCASIVNIASASAAPTDPFQFNSYFDTAALPNGMTTAAAVAVNDESGNVLVYDSGQGTIDQFDSAGEPVDFPATGTPTLPVVNGAEELIVDNSGTATQGNIYTFAPHASFYTEAYSAWNENGEALAANPLTLAEFVPVTNTIAVAPDGKLWAAQSGFGGSPPLHMVQIKPNGEPAGTEFEVEGFNIPCCESSWGPSIFDGNNHFYYSGVEGTFGRWNGNVEFHSEGETGLPDEFNNPRAEEVAVEPATNDLAFRRGEQILAVHYSDPLVKSTPYTVVEGLSPSGGFNYDATGQTIYVAEGTRVSVLHREPPAGPHELKPIEIDSIRSSSARLHSGLIAGGAPTRIHFEYGTTTSYGNSTPVEALPYTRYPVTVGADLSGLQPNTVYHVRLVAESSLGTAYGVDRTFKTYAVPGGAAEAACPNALARKQTGALRLPSCRAYELVSAADTAGYDVESYLAPGQHPFPGFPGAPDKVLYSTHSGAIPGPWDATNNGVDPYLAQRTEAGWKTTYEGLPANINALTPSFASSLGEADPKLGNLAFGGPKLCSPCFTGGGLETGIPVRLADGSLVQGMAGSLTPASAAAEPEGKVARWFSADGRDLVFASRYAFEPGANTGGDLTVYERDLAAGTTRIVSTDPSGATLTGAGISELAISADGSRVLIGRRVSVDAAGNEYVHPYLHIAGRQGSVDLDPGGTAGVLFAGMSEDGSTVYFTTTDSLLPADEDPSADLYEAQVDPSGLATVHLLSGGGAASCNPVSNKERAHWNSVGAAANCDPLAVGGGGGVSASGEVVYFLSPEQLDGAAGTLDQPNLYRVQAAGAPRFVATLEPDNPLVLDSLDAAGTRRTGDFQVTPSGRFAAFLSAAPLTGVHTFGDLQVFRYDAAGSMVCASCDTTETNDDSLADDAELAPDGLSLLEDGRVFFNTRQELVLNDANRRIDVYQYSDAGGQQLISSGSGAFDSGLLTASTNGTDVFFFTHEELAPEEDETGALMKIYDAREGGGFFKLPADVPCKASDECHGPGTVAPAPPVIQSSGKSTPGNHVTCKKNQVKRAGKCVKKPGSKKPKKKHKRKHTKKNPSNKKGTKHA